MKYELLITKYKLQPYRAGYAFKEWSVVSGEEETTKTDSTFIIAADTQITAVWEEASYKVSFTGGGTGQPEPLWEVSVPYGDVYKRQALI